MKITKELIEALRNTKSESNRKLLDQAAAVLAYYYVKEEEEELVAKYRRFASAAYGLLGIDLAESVNDALHLYYSLEQFHSYEGEREDLFPLLVAFDAEGLNSIFPAFDVLRGGQFTAPFATGGAEDG